MFKLIVASYLVFLFTFFVGVDNKILKLDLFRQRTPHINALNTGNLGDIGVWVDWLKGGKNKATNHSIALFRFLDSEFYGRVAVGSKNQSINVIYDTAWTTSWLISKDCPSTNPGCWFHNKYDHAHSATYIPSKGTYIANEGSYNLSGYYSIDNMNVGGVTIKQQRFVEMTNIPYTYLFSKVDGVLGLSPPYGEDKTFVQHMLDSGAIKRAIFSLYLNRDRQSNRGGVIMVGAYDKKHIHVTNKVYDNITYVDSDTSRGLWEFNLDSVYLEKTKNNSIVNNTIVICDKGCSAFADSGSNAIIASEKEIGTINKLIGARESHFGRYEVDCDTVNKLPTIYFIINGNQFGLTGKDYVQKVSYMAYQICISAFTPATTASESGSWILGGAFLSTYYSIYDMEKNTIGFVKAA